MSKKQGNKRNYNILEPQEPIKYNAMMRTIEELKAMFNVLDNSELDKRGIAYYPDEIFVQLPKYPKYYVSNYGDVLSACKKKWWFISKSKNEKGYLYATTITKSNAKFHVLVANLFLKNIHGYYEGNNVLEVHHKDGERSNNRADNLEIVHNDNHLPLLHTWNNSFSTEGQEIDIYEFRHELEASWETIRAIKDFQEEQGKGNHRLFALGTPRGLYANVLVDTDTGKIVKVSSHCEDYYITEPDKKKELEHITKVVQDWIDNPDRYELIANCRLKEI